MPDAYPITEYEAMVRFSRSTAGAFFDTVVLHHPDLDAYRAYGSQAVSQVDSCFLYRRGAPTDASQPVYQPLDIGPLSVTGTRTPFTLNYSTNQSGAGYWSTGDQAIWDDGAELTVRGGGQAGFPAFTLTLPATTTETKLSLPPLVDNTFIVDRNAGLHLSWIGAGPGLFTVEIDQDHEVSEPGQLTSIYCQFPVDKGSGDIPAAALAGFAATGTGPRAMFFASVRTNAYVGDEGWGVIGSVSTDATVDGSRPDRLLTVDFR